MSLSTLKRRLGRAEERFFTAAKQDEALSGWTARSEA
jgi:hypothetical protein